MEKRHISARKLCCILLVLVVAIMFAGNSSVVYGGLLGNLFKSKTSKTPQFVENIDKVTIGMTKQQVQIWLGNPDGTNTSTKISQVGESFYNPAKTSSKKIISKEVVTDQWYYGSMYKTGNSTGYLTKSLLTNQVVGIGSNAIMSKLPFGALIGIRGQVTQTGMNIMSVAATNTMNPEDPVGTAHAEIYFSNGYVTSKSHNIPTASISNYNTTSSQSAVVGSVFGTKVHSLLNGREFHNPECSTLDNAEGLITFPSEETARSEGAVPHSDCIR